MIDNHDYALISDNCLIIVFDKECALSAADIIRYWLKLNQILVEAVMINAHYRY